MMKRVKPYLFLILFFLFILSLSEAFTAGLRSLSVSALIPFWSGVDSAKAKKRETIDNELVALFKVENELLKTQIENLKEWIVFEGRREEELNRLLWLRGMEENDQERSDYYKRRADELGKLIELQMQALPAKVVFREPISWSSSLWLNVGKKENEKHNKIIVAKDSPVVVGSSLVGVVEQVESHKCRVRLITDSGLVPSVRAVRGEEQRRVLSAQLSSLWTTLKMQEELKGSTREEKELLDLIDRVYKKWQSECISSYLAKGELFGTSAPLWRSRGGILRGVGFNYDFADDEGPARHLRAERALLRVGDLLVTTGFDAVFPAGLHVARVMEIGRLREGASSYELTAKPTAGNLDHLETLFVLPPLEAKD